MSKKTLILALALLCPVALGAQTAKSLFWRSDSVQIRKAVSDIPDQYKTIGHHGPAVENPYYALRIYFNDSGAIDLYSKSGKQMELLKYLWYPTEAQQAAEGAGCDQYKVAGTVGLGGINLWDGKRAVKLNAKSRTAKVGRTIGGSYAMMTAYGVPCGGDTLDIQLRVDVRRGSRKAKVTAHLLHGAKAQFYTGVNVHPGLEVKTGLGYIATWGIHPEDVSGEPGPVGAALHWNFRKFTPVVQDGDTYRIISPKVNTVKYWIYAASAKEEELNTAEKFFNFILDL